jgi:hypothetical protein
MFCEKWSEMRLGHGTNSARSGNQIGEFGSSCQRIRCDAHSAKPGARKANQHCFGTVLHVDNDAVTCLYSTGSHTARETLHMVKKIRIAVRTTVAIEGIPYEEGMISSTCSKLD